MLAGVAGAVSNPVVGGYPVALGAVDPIGPALPEKEFQADIIGGKVLVKVSSGILLHGITSFNVIPLYQSKLRALRGTSPIPNPHHKCSYPVPQGSLLFGILSCIVL